MPELKTETKTGGDILRVGKVEYLIKGGDAEPLLDTIEAAKLVGTTAAGMAQLRVRNLGPRYIKLGRAVRYRSSDLQAWIEANSHSPTRQPKRGLRQGVPPEGIAGGLAAP